MSVASVIPMKESGNGSKSAKLKAAKSRMAKGKSKSLKLKKAQIDRYRMYEAAVQDAEQQIRLFHQIYFENFGIPPTALREDFSGTFWISSEWVKQSDTHRAVALDIDDEALAVGKHLHYDKLKAAEQKRLSVRNQNVLVPTSDKIDVVAACNFSYFIFQERQVLVDYFRAVRESMSRGILTLETSGGAGFEETPLRERKTVKYPNGKNKGKKWFRYTWHQRSFDPIHRRGLYSIHFDIHGGKKIKDAYVYDWRIWTIPEVSDALLEAGFDEVQVYWEQDDPDEDGYTVYERQAVANNDYHTWIVYLTGVAKG